MFRCIGIFLSEYLLYRYDHGDQAEEGGEWDMAEFECRLKKYRQMKNLTQEQLAEKAGVRLETIMRLLNYSGCFGGEGYDKAAAFGKTVGTELDINGWEREKMNLGQISVKRVFLLAWLGMAVSMLAICAVFFAIIG